MKWQLLKGRIAGRTLHALLLAAGLSLLLVSMASAGFGTAFISQCSNNNSPQPLGTCNWINGIVQSSNSVFFEGMAMPQRVMWDGITPVSGSNTHTITFSVMWTKSGHHSYDFLTSYAQAQTLAANNFLPMTMRDCGDLPTGGQPPTPTDECNDVFTGGAHSNFILVDVPDDPYASADCNPNNATNCAVQNKITVFEGKYGNRTIELFGNASISSATLTLAHDVGNLLDTGDSFVNYTLTYTSASTVVLLQMAGHIACGTDSIDPGVCWGTGLSAGNINGGPYHFKNFTFDGTGGSQDNQLSIAAIPAPPGMTTAISSASIQFGQSVTDQLTLTGSNGTINGTVNFFVCGPTSGPVACTTGGTQVPPNNQTVNGASPQVVTSGSFTPGSIGTWCFRTEFTHLNANYSSGVETTTTGECVTVSKSTAVTLSSFKATAQPTGGSGQISVAWSTGSEVNTAGFNLYRSDSAQGPYIRINSELIPASNDALAGGKYQYLDISALPGHAYYYQLEDVELNGSSVRHPAVQVTAASAAASGALPAAMIGLGIGLLALAAGGAFVLRRKARRA